jgi:hypothetical protein
MSQYGLAAATVRIPTLRPAQSDREQLSGAEASLGMFRGRSSIFLRGYSSYRSTCYSSMRSHNAVRRWRLCSSTAFLISVGAVAAIEQGWRPPVAVETLFRCEVRCGSSDLRVTFYGMTGFEV